VVGRVEAGGTRLNEDAAIDDAARLMGVGGERESVMAVGCHPTLPVAVCGTDWNRLRLVMGDQVE
jgi:hypothetical protein